MERELAELALPKYATAPDHKDWNRLLLYVSALEKRIASLEAWQQYQETIEMEASERE